MALQFYHSQAVLHSAFGKFSSSEFNSAHSEPESAVQNEPNRSLSIPIGFNAENRMKWLLERPVVPNLCVFTNYCSLSVSTIFEPFAFVS